ncbi:MAG: ABC transporter permease [Hyphomicrobiaceae bacterium]
MGSETLPVTKRPDGGLEAVATGAWTAEHAEAVDRAVSVLLDGLDTGVAVSLRMAAVTRFDTYGAWQLERLARSARTRGAHLEVTGLDARFAGLAAAVGHTPVAGPVPPARRRLARLLAAVRNAADAAANDILALLELLGAVGWALVVSIVRPATFRLTSLVHQVDRVAWQAVPIVVLITFLIGAIIAQQGFFHFRKFGADQYVVDMVGILVLREIGVLLVAIMVAGRSGSSYTAELGSMKMREEIDALRTMGLDPVAVLILPRVLALTLALPALAFLGSLSALYGGGLVAWLYGDMAPAIFVERLRDAVSLTHFKVGLVKAPFMAVVIGLVACTEGLKVKGSAESLGRQTTVSVVKSIFLVIVLDGVFAIYFSAIGM